jgi:hypothetical protein
MADSKYFSGTYIGGHPDLTPPIKLTKMDVEGQDVVIYAPKFLSWTERARIPISAITDIAAEDATTAGSRVTATRLALLGPLAFIAKKNKTEEKIFVTITWGNGKIPNETIFEFEGKFQGKPAQTTANVLKGALTKAVNSHSA